MSYTMIPALALGAIALSPELSQAARPEQSAAQACAEAFIASLATPEKPAPRLKATTFYGIDQLLEEPSELYLTAVSTRTHAPIAKATCTLSVRGKVLSIAAEPLAAL
ncbi:MAG: hypothetical protein KGL25_13415 [Gammaproteobacteria bacterium]|nr:hypothetical protein [Gammaproteobacteria bacterium]